MTFNIIMMLSLRVIDRGIRYYIGTILRDLRPQKSSDDGSTFKASLVNIEEAAQVFLAPRDMDHFNWVLSNPCRKYKVEQVGMSFFRDETKIILLP